MNLKLRFSFTVDASRHHHAFILNTLDPAHARLNIHREDLDKQTEMLWEAEHYVRNHLIVSHIQFPRISMEDEGVLAPWTLTLGGVQFSDVAYFPYSRLTHDSLPLGDEWEQFLRDHLYHSQDDLNVTMANVRQYEPPRPPLQAAYAVKLGEKTKVYAKESTAKAQIRTYGSSYAHNNRFPEDCSIWKVSDEGWELIFMAEQGQHRAIIPW